jgi:DNA processing protein
MAPHPETTALIALLRRDPNAWRRVIAAGDADAQLDAEQGLFADESRARARAELEAWERRGIRVISAFDSDYPVNLAPREQYPPLLFVGGALRRSDALSVAVIGTRRPSASGRRSAAAIAKALTGAGHVVVSGLAVGIDAAAHRAALDAGGRTLAVLGNGLDRCYPREHTGLQRQIARSGAVISQFWPESPPSRHTFPVRNALMAGITRATVIVEASARSGTRIQAREALAHGRPVLLLAGLVEQQQWARELAELDGVHIVESPRGVVDLLARIQHAPPAPEGRAGGGAAYDAAQPILPFDMAA